MVLVLRLAHQYHLFHPLHLDRLRLLDLLIHLVRQHQLSLVVLVLRHFHQHLLDLVILLVLVVLLN